MRRREDKDSYYLNIAEAVLRRSTCLRRKYGAVIVRDDEIISTGYNGSPRGMVNCCDVGHCYREEQKIPHGERYEACKGVHAEANAIISAPRRDMIGATLYLAGQEADGTPIADPAPCSMCYRLILNAGISTIVTRNGRKEVKDCECCPATVEAVPQFPKGEWDVVSKPVYLGEGRSEWYLVHTPERAVGLVKHKSDARLIATAPIMYNLLDKLVHTKADNTFRFLKRISEVVLNAKHLLKMLEQREEASHEN